MKKILVLLTIAVLVCALGVFAFAACDFEKPVENEEEGEKDPTATDRAGSVALIAAFFEETLKDPDLVVTCKNRDGEVQSTETVKGTASCTVNEGGATYYYVKDGVYYWVSVTQETKDGETVETHYYCCSDQTKESYLMDMDKVYQAGYCQFMANIHLVKSLPDEDATILCTTHTEEVDGVTTATLTYDYAITAGTFKITAVSENGLVKTVHILLTDATAPQTSRDLTWTFVYGSAQVTLPDTDAWDREEAAKRKRLEDNESAITARDEFFSSATDAENVRVTVMNVLTFSTLMTETIANDIDYVDQGDHKTYAFTEEEDDGTDAYILVDDKGQKTYTKNGDDYGDNCLVWYSSFIGCKDSLTETADFTFENKDGTMTYNVKVNGSVVYSISVTGNQTSITQIGVSGIDEDGNSFVTAIMLSYDSAQLQKPDLSDYTYVE